MPPVQNTRCKNKNTWHAVLQLETSGDLYKHLKITISNMETVTVYVNVYYIYYINQTQSLAEIQGTI